MKKQFYSLEKFILFSKSLFLKQIVQLNNCRDDGAWKWNDDSEWDDAVIHKLWSKGEPNNRWGNEDRMEGCIV